MLVLGVDTSTAAVSLGLVDLDDDRVLAAPDPLQGRRHTELLAPGVHELLRSAGAAPRALGAIVVGLGPGPFTGLRVGVVTGAGLGDALGIPVYGRCSLDGLAGQVSGAVVAVSDARRREVYWARYDAGGQRTTGPAVTTPARLAEELEGDAVPLVGEGAHLYPAAFAGRAVLDQPRHPSAAVLVQRLAGLIRSGAPPDPLVPLYLRRPDATEPGAAKRVTA